MYHIAKIWRVRHVPVKGLNIDVCMFLICFDDFQKRKFNKHLLFSRFLFFALNRRHDCSPWRQRTRRIVRRTTLNAHAVTRRSYLRTNMSCYVTRSLTMTPSHSSELACSECNTDWGGNQHAHSLPTANERVTANEWFWEVSQNLSLASSFSLASNFSFIGRCFIGEKYELIVFAGITTIMGLVVVGAALVA